MGSEEEEYVLPEWIEKQWKRAEESRAKLVGEVSKIPNSRLRRTPDYMAERAEFRRYYFPHLIAIGPVHLNRRINHLQGEPFKDAWTTMYLTDTNQTLKDLYNTIIRESELLKEISQLHEEETWYEYIGEAADINEFITWLIVVDGCSILHLLEKSGNSVDPQGELKISVDKLVRMHQDLLVMDNQIPFQVLRLFCKDEARLEKCLRNFLQVHGIKTAPELRKEKKNTQEAARELKLVVQGDDDQNKEDPVHLLDYLRMALLMRDFDTIHKEIRVEIKIKRRSLHLTKYRIGTIRELKAAGISLRRHLDGNSIYPSFKDGTLHLPELVVDGTTAHIYLNLVAYEMCPEFHNDFEISSYLVLMSSLVDQPEDVKELRLAGILTNELASDKEVSDLFNKMDIILVPETPWFANIRDQIHLHFESKRRKIKMLSWMGEAYNTFFRSPWTIIALLAATLGLVLTFIQTWFAIHPK